MTAQLPRPMVVDPTPALISSDPPMLVDLSETTAAQVASDCPPFDSLHPASLPLPLQHPNPRLRVISSAQMKTTKIRMKDVLDAYSFVVLDLEQMPLTTLDDLLYSRYGSRSKNHLIISEVYY
jgi:hypothetical protein